MLKLGTARHHDGLLRGIDNMDDIGCFALTELGFGNNAVEMQVSLNLIFCDLTKRPGPVQQSMLTC